MGIERGGAREGKGAMQRKGRGSEAEGQRESEMEKQRGRKRSITYQEIHRFSFYVFAACLCYRSFLEVTGEMCFLS